MKTNVKSRFKEVTHEGAQASRTNAEQELRRSLMSCMLWENEFYEDGISVAERIADLVKFVSPGKVLEMVNEARNKMNLRHAPLWVIREMARLEDHKHLVAQALDCAIQRPDDMTEFLSLYWKDGRQTLSAQVKKGLAKAFKKFSAYQLAKYNRDDAVKLRDVLFLCHAKPETKEQEATWKSLVNGTLESPDTWEVALSAGKDKKTEWERLLKENKLGAMALLRNLRNMKETGVDEKLIFAALENAKTDRVLPFRFIAAARHAPQWEDKIELVMLKCVEGREKLPGKTILLVDVSGSMDAVMSEKSDMLRVDAACGLAVLARELCENVEIYSFSRELKQIPPRRGFALRDAINTSQSHGGTYLGAAINAVNGMKRDRLIVITDEQSADIVPDPSGAGYMINVASNKNGIGYGKWTHIDGFSEAIFDYIVKQSDK